ncbi:transposase [Streptomyces sp. FXJ1.172]|uniref:transposase n=1 Tax=Streptomyces sp. FXJ1.172 TaxID=710705 RepID=UPI0007CFF22D|nr:transposase [Streptomyces sp. FXJ1.172]WEO93230.1 transposase [Streptomyces sp. FXJ1.172]
MLDAIRYVTDNGIKWRSMPADFPAWDRVYAFFRTDCLGLLLMVLVYAADVTDRQAARVMLPRLRAQFHKITLVWADGGYTGCLVTWTKEKLQLISGTSGS